MTQYINIVLLIVNIISVVITVLFGLFGVYEYIMGPADAAKLLKKLHFPVNYHQVLIIGFANTILMIITFILRVMLTEKM